MCGRSIVEQQRAGLSQSGQTRSVSSTRRPAISPSQRTWHTRRCTTCHTSSSGSTVARKLYRSTILHGFVCAQVGHKQLGLALASSASCASRAGFGRKLATLATLAPLTLAARRKAGCWGPGACRQICIVPDRNKPR